MSYRPLGVRLFIVCAGILWLGAGPVFAQTSSSILGNVRDKSGAIVPGATVTAVHLGTRTSYSTVTDDRGDYRIDVRQVGRFDLRIELSGFKSAAFSNVLIEIGQAARLDAVMEVGQIS